ncbi:hypothetical protein [Bifidobacterium platyrrhinorum]|uniref:Scaffolding protein n=1 Tax=Bifidobacterium platyrrhinorum TaxID=2661628 RepID=A0A6L9SUE6_9BIFI|nr:hypothetical protein [Bifidobacterium platyrrhinorum]NEG55463.1 hypothetical protein [Bifidobacterium platyrrhinorum]
MADNEETQTTPDTETGPQVKPETGADESANVQAEPQTDSDEVAKWKAMSRKNQKQSEANLHQLQQVQAELAQMKTDNARLTAKNTHPQITDDVLALCSETEPDKIAAWAEQYAKLNPVNAGEVKPKPARNDPEALKTSLLAENPQGVTNPKPKRGDAYKRSQERQKSRRRNHKTN